MRLGLLLKGIPGKRAGAKADPDLKGICENSRSVRSGELFAALPGSKVDGRSFVKEALARGASALLLQGGPLKGVDVAQFCVKDGAGTLAVLAHRFHGDPTKRMKVLGVTGTKGKTTTTYLLRSLLEGSGRPAALIGTIAYDTGLRTYEAVNTTPSALTLAQLLAEARKCRREWAAMEVSSHALEMDRVKGIAFKGAIFTNLGRDHLDYHRTRAAYFKAKRRLFTEFPSLKARLVNADDEHGKKLLGELKGRGTGYGVRTSCAYRAKDVSLEPGRIRFSVQGKKFEAPMSGLFNVYNALAAVSLLREMGIPWGALREGLRSAPAVPGRFEEVAEGQDFTVLVDYAHTADALEQALNAARGILKEKGRLICVFGCGGDRDRGKRPLMGGVSARLADKTILTSDNPRTEDPRAILEGILEGIPDHLRLNGTRRVFVEEERAAAIRMALSMAVPGDLVLIAGKGHETYQVLGARKVHFDDREVARQVLKDLRKD